MPQAPDRQGTSGRPGLEDARRLAEWQPPLGVLSVYLRLDPGDRGGGWRTELRNGLSAVLDATEGYDHDTRAALRATADRVSERLANHERGLPRGEIGFVEVAEDGGAERWWETHLPPDGAASVCFAGAPVVAPLLNLAGRDAARGVVLVSAERLRLLEWMPGHLEELERWELSVFMRDWRERKAQRVPNPARSQAVSSSGREHFGDRLADNRHHFLDQCRQLAEREARERGWPELLAFGQRRHREDFLEGSDSSPTPFVAAAETDLISAPDGQLTDRVGEAVQNLAAERERELAERALGEAQGGMRGTAGPQETFAALREDRVGHLVLDGTRAAAACSEPLLAAERAEGGAIGTEPMVRRALGAGADATAVSGEAAELLAPHDGVAALLRY